MRIFFHVQVREKRLVIVLYGRCWQAWSLRHQRNHLRLKPATPRLNRPSCDKIRVIRSVKIDVTGVKKPAPTQQSKKNDDGFIVMCESGARINEEFNQQCGWNLSNDRDFEASRAIRPS